MEEETWLKLKIFVNGKLVDSSHTGLNCYMDFIASLKRDNIIFWAQHIEHLNKGWVYMLLKEKS